MNYLQKICLFSTLAVLLLCTSKDRRIGADDLIHIVGRGETIYSISRFYNVSADELMRANRISDPSKMQAGSRLIIPSSQEVQAVLTSPPVNLTDYRAVRGDTLYSIARTNGISLQTLLDINKFTSSHVLKAGDVIKVPVSGTAASSGSTGSGAASSGAASSGAASSGAASRVNAAQTTQANSAPSVSALIYNLRWPVIPKDIAYMTGQMGVVVEGEHNEPVRSLTQGQVISAGPWRKFGRVVIVETAGGLFYMYGGCESLSVHVGDRILPGSEVGKLGIHTVSDKPQLFFMVFRSGNPIDPASAPRA